MKCVEEKKVNKAFIVYNYVCRAKWFMFCSILPFSDIGDQILVTVLNFCRFLTFIFFQNVSLFIKRTMEKPVSFADFE
jgi:hypothetical protein